MSFDIAAELGARLSPGAAVLVPGNDAFASLVSRWREWHAPTVAALVQVATEADVQETIRFSNEHSLAFFGRSGGHGGTEAMALATDSVQIDFRKMNHVDLAEDGKTARIGGGINVKQVVEALGDAGKRTVTGICESVGISAVALGGGHGWLQGQYGLPADQIVSARLVLPDGDVVIVSEDSNSDLFYAIKGAGHNFGFVTEWTYRVYDINARAPKWSYEIFVFSGDKLEAVFDLANEMMKSQPPQAIHWSYIIRVAQIDPEHPIIWYGIIYDGPEHDAREYAKPLHDIGAMTIQAGQATTHELAALTFQDSEGPGCAKGLTSLRYPIGLKTFNVPAMRKVYDHIDASFRAVPEIAGSFFLLEGYSTQAVKAVDEASAAFPHRSDEVLVTSYVQYRPDPKIDPIAKVYGIALRDILLEASDDPGRLRAYVNYAHGTEDLRAVYGWEDWRLAKLRQLKAKWDPENRMRFYLPIK
ncbi:FAD-binding domain-containing protein [Xylariomycetidae sp. FL2044]|nr:FAD-binding domain-containing protein [Xylariomycetidae sp. FL2044]